MNTAERNQVAAALHDGIDRARVRSELDYAYGAFVATAEALKAARADRDRADDQFNAAAMKYLDARDRFRQLCAEYVGQEPPPMEITE